MQFLHGYQEDSGLGFFGNAATEPMAPMEVMNAVAKGILDGGYRAAVDEFIKDFIAAKSRGEARRILDVFMKEKLLFTSEAVNFFLNTLPVAKLTFMEGVMLSISPTQGVSSMAEYNKLPQKVKDKVAAVYRLNFFEQACQDQYLAKGAYFKSVPEAKIKAMFKKFDAAERLGDKLRVKTDLMLLSKPEGDEEAATSSAQGSTAAADQGLSGGQIAAIVLGGIGAFGLTMLFMKKRK